MTQHGWVGVFDWDTKGASHISFFCRDCCLLAPLTVIVLLISICRPGLDKEGLKRQA